MSDSLEQSYYEMLTRTDHPVLKRDFSDATDIDSPINSIMNRIMADQLVRLKSVVDELRLNSYPHLATELTIDDWENQYFGFTKPSLPLERRIEELLIKFNRRFTMSLADVKSLALAIVGVEPIVTRNLDRRGFVLGHNILGYSTVLGSAANESIGTYLVIFVEPIDPDLIEKLDNRLTIIEKGGSRHRIVSELPRWTLGESALGVTTILS